MAVSQHRPRVVVVGGINMDLIGVAPRLPSPGETVAGTDFYTTPGGKGANQAVAAARMGADVKMVGRVGDDVFGPMLLRSLEESGVDTGHVSAVQGSPSGIAMILLNEERQNHIIQVYGANRADAASMASDARDVLEDADILMLQLETPMEASVEAARAAKALGVLVVWDPAPAESPPEEMVGLADLLAPNQTEAEALTGFAVNDLQSAERAAAALLGMGAVSVVVKLAELGAFYAGPEGRGHVPPFPAEPTDTVAAGDAFGAAMAVAMAEGHSLKEAVRWGNAAGALAVTKPGAQNAMPHRAEVEATLGRR